MLTIVTYSLLDPLSLFRFNKTKINNSHNDKTPTNRWVTMDSKYDNKEYKRKFWKTYQINKVLTTITISGERERGDKKEIPVLRPLQPLFLSFILHTFCN